MSLPVGTRFGPYEVLAPIGAGGMGEVYKAKDTRLDREVAIKVLPQNVALDPDRLARFEREAKVLASLNHPNIAHIYGLEESGDTRALVMELVAGSVLSVPQPLDTALEYARHIAEAIEAAHEKGITHRDLKPGNIMITPEGTVKVLDFGLALVHHLETPGGDPTTSPTVTMSTRAGLILGTAAYMSPEQASGKLVDRRSDIWSFGVVLWEMLTGTRLFGGETISHTLADVLKGDIDFNALPPQTPPTIRQLLRRCLDRDVKTRLQWIGEARIAIDKAGDAAPAPVRHQRGRLWWWLAAMAACVAASFAGAWWLLRPAPEPARWRLIRLTNDPGLSGFAALSPDAKLVAYSSDNKLDGGRDLFVKQVAGGQPIRLTSDGEANSTPDFSPDGSKIVFRSSRDGGGIYEIAAFGGEARLLAREGANPKYSPDGSQVAYWVGNLNVQEMVPGGGTVWVVPVAGGQPRRVGNGLTTARFPVWSPDGKRLLVLGYRSDKANETSQLDWWFVDVNGTGATRTGVCDVLVEAGLIKSFLSERAPHPACWAADTSAVVFSKADGDTSNLWQVGISERTGQATQLQRLTTGAGNEVDPACAASGAVAFTSVDTRRNIWSMRFDPDAGTPTGPLEQITEGLDQRETPALSGDGRFVAFSSNQLGPINIWRREVATGKESSVARSAFLQRYPAITKRGDRIAFSVYENDKRLIYVSTPGGTPEKLCDGCLRATDWSADEKSLLVYGGNPYRIDLLNVASHQQTPLFQHPTYSLLHGRFSSDNRWVCFTARIAANRSRITIAPVDGPTPVPESAWIAIAEGATAAEANWSPDGRTVYFISAKDGYECLWGQRLDAGSHQPVGEAFPVQHVHGRTISGFGGWSLAAGRIAVALSETTGNVWLMSRAVPR